MLKFFRRIRRKLIDEGNLKRYFIYAIGEILLVMIGILLALQVNNWNENKKNQAQEFNYIVEINREFKDNKTELEYIVKEHKKVLEKCESLIMLFPISLENPAYDTLSKLVDESWRYWNFNPSQNAINSLTNLSSFQNMKNKKLKGVLSSWKVILNDYLEAEMEAMNFVMNRYDPYLSDNFHYDFDLTDPRTNLNILQTFKFENLIKERAWQQNEILTGDNDLKRLQSTIDKIIDLTEKEIN